MRKNHHHILCLQLLLNHKCCLKDSLFFTDIYEVTRHKLTYACVYTHKRTPQTEWGKWYGEGNAILQSTYYTLLPLSRNKLAFLYHCGLTKTLSPFLQAASNLKQQYGNSSQSSIIWHLYFTVALVVFFIWQF